jgi:hypothetical protein
VVTREPSLAVVVAAVERGQEKSLQSSTSTKDSDASVLTMAVDPVPGTTRIVDQQLSLPSDPIPDATDTWSLSYQEHAADPVPPAREPFKNGDPWSLMTTVSESYNAQSDDFVASFDYSSKRSLLIPPERTRCHCRLRSLAIRWTMWR